MLKKNGKYLLFLFFVLFMLSWKAVEGKAQEVAAGERISGSNRFETSIKISKAGWNPGDTEVAVIATGMNYADALSATPLAKKNNAPILLTPQDYLRDNLIGELKRLKVKKVFIIGGDSAVSKEAEKQLKSLGISFERLQGKDRYSTSVAVAEEIGSKGEIIVTTGVNFPDTLSIAPYAAAKGIPILLTHPYDLPSEIKNYISDNRIDKSYVIGGPSAVSQEIAVKLPDYERIEGKDRYGTNIAIMKRFARDFQFEKLYLATGVNFPDALSGSALAALTDSPVVLVPMTNQFSTRKFIRDYESEIKNVYLLGGDNVLPNSAAGGVAPPTIMDLELLTYRKGVVVDRQFKISLKMTMLSPDHKNPSVTFTVSDPSILSVEEDGTVTGLKPGKATITAQVGEKSSKLEIETRERFLIVVDPGHGGTSSGAMPVTREYEKREAVLNMQISEKLRDKLQDAGIDVVLTREGDKYVSLDGRADIANKIGADLFISIHHDANTSSSANGTSAYYNSYKPGLVDKEVSAEVAEHSRDLAVKVNAAVASLGLNNRGVFQNDFAVNRLTNLPSVLVEVGFLTNLEEFKLISQDSFQEKVAEKVTEAVLEFLKDY